MPQQQSPRVVLFLCTGNYYRSRFAEVLFNARAAEAGMAWVAASRGLELHACNVGPINGGARPAILRRVQRDRARQAQHGADARPHPIRLRRHLKSLREKITIAPNSSAAM
jgi:hypothetical protein